MLDVLRARPKLQSIRIETEGVDGGGGEQREAVGTCLGGASALQQSMRDDGHRSPPAHLLHSTTAGIVLVIYFVLYQQLENQVIQPVVYGKTVRLSPLAVLVAVLAGAQLAGIIGALGAIPIAAAIQVGVLDILAQRGSRIVAPPENYEAPPAGADPAVAFGVNDGRAREAGAL